MMDIFKTKSGKRVIAQTPNWPIITAAILRIAYGLTNNQPLELAFHIVLIYWALLEVFQGVNTWRRFLGTLVLAVTARSLYLFLTS